MGVVGEEHQQRRSNNDGGFTNVHIAGSNVTAVMANALHAEEIVLTNIPVVTTAFAYGTLLPGQLYTCFAPNSGFLCSPIFIV
jgi:hypothetical protein